MHFFSEIKKKISTNFPIMTTDLTDQTKKEFEQAIITWLTNFEEYQAKVAELKAASKVAQAAGQNCPWLG